MYMKLFWVIDVKIGVVLIAFLTCCAQALPFLIIYALVFSEFGEFPNSGCLSIGTVYWLLLFFASAPLITGMQKQCADSLRPWLCAEPFAWMLMPIPLYLYSEVQFPDKKWSFLDMSKLDVLIQFMWVALVAMDCLFVYFYVFILILFRRYKTRSSSSGS